MSGKSLKLVASAWNPSASTNHYSAGSNQLFGGATPRPSREGWRRDRAGRARLVRAFSLNSYYKNGATNYAPPKRGCNPPFSL
jgi:hypothetical protein